METFREIAEMHYDSEPNNEFDKQYRANRINALEKLLTVQLGIGAVSGSTDFLSEQLPIVEWNDYEYKPQIAFYGTEWEIWYQAFDKRIPQNILMNKYGDTLNDVLDKMINEVLVSGLKYYR